MRWLNFLFLIVLAGCMQPQKPVWDEVPTAEQLIGQISVASGSFSSLDGAASVALTTGDKFFSSEQFLLLQRPDRLRADVLTGFGQLVLQMASDGDLLSVFLNTTVPGKFFYGPASYENIFRFVRVPLMTTDLLSLLLYDPPLIDYQDSSVELVAGGIRLVLANDDDRQELLFNGRLQLIGCDYYRLGDEYLSVEYEKFSKESSFPQLIKIAMPLEKTRIKVTFSELQVNERIDLAQFQLHRPDNAIIERLP
ncbi:hypothetical protein [uncultured Desulfuromusa sp.]|uniref:hypothetical protein n=1 Tax=uncultured Desulfuromusa sp. TaxID=219183 RepID=UPI002AA8D215|nr:hypothetical protein [uncultured Desulfuromusa sp.]